MAILNPIKEPLVAQIEPGGSFQVRLQLTGKPDIEDLPIRLILLLDHSGSMQGRPLQALKHGVTELMNLLQAAAGSSGSSLGNTKAALVGFSDYAVIKQDLTADAQKIISAVECLQAGGKTNHQDAFLKAKKLMEQGEDKQTVIVLFTDGNTTAGGCPNYPVQQLKEAGAQIYCIGLEAAEGVNMDLLTQWASKPSDFYARSAESPDTISNLFHDLALDLIGAGGKLIRITDRVTSCFRITALQAPSNGVAYLQDEKTLVWEMEVLGAAAEQQAELIFTVQHMGSSRGTVAFNQETTYEDAAGSHIVFPNPTITVCTEGAIHPDPLPEAVEVTVQGCQETALVDGGVVRLHGLGRVVEVNVTLKDVCPEKRIALAVFLMERDQLGNLHHRGRKIFEIPAHHGETCRDIEVTCLKFVLPETEDQKTAHTLCKSRMFQIQTIANYLDCDVMPCCE